MVSPAAGGWGLAPAIYTSLWFRTGALLCPVWLPLLMGLAVGPQPGGTTGLMLLLAFFIFIPGVYVLANSPRLGKLARVFACVVYALVAEAVAFTVLSGLDSVWRT